MNKNSLVYQGQITVNQLNKMNKETRWTKQKVCLPGSDDSNLSELAENASKHVESINCKKVTQK